MKVGMNLLLWTDMPTHQVFSLLEQIRDRGFDGVEFLVPDMEEQDVKILARQCNELGRGRSCLAASSAQRPDPSPPDPGLREARLRELKKSIDQLRGLGDERLSGPFDQGWPGSREAVPHGTIWNVQWK